MYHTNQLIYKTQLAAALRTHSHSQPVWLYKRQQIQCNIRTNWR